MDDILTAISQNHIPQILCLFTQFVITVHTAYNLSKNKEQFPVKQLSPLLSLTALVCFFVINCISFTAKLIETSNHYYDPDYQSQTHMCGQCRLYNRPQMIILAVLYNGLRQLPLIIFIIKTYRVCLCYKISYQKQLSDQVKWLFSQQRKLLYLSLLITVLLMVAGYFVLDDGQQHFGYLVFEFFCPKQSSAYDWLVTTIRFLAMAYVYVISIYTYSQLDFKRFLILIFILTNTQVLLRLILALADITKTTYHQFYYHSFTMNLFGTLIMLYYSTIKEQRNQPLTLPILESFKGFLQSTLGFTVLTYFAEQLDNEEMAKSNPKLPSNNEQTKNKENNKIVNSAQKSHKHIRQRSSQKKQHLTASKQTNQYSNKYQRMFQTYILIEEITIFAAYNNYKVKPESIEQLIEALEHRDVASLISNSQYLLQKCRNRQIGSVELQELGVKLERFCERFIFQEWRQTESCKYLQTQFKNNGVINLRMNYLGIKLK